MSDFGNYSNPADASALEATDPGLRKFMLGVYEKMAVGLIVAAALVTPSWWAMSFAWAFVPFASQCWMSVTAARSLPLRPSC